MAKYKIHVNPNQNTQQAQIVQQLAQNAANQQLQQQAEPVDDMRTTVNDLIKNSLITPVEMPKYTTIQDVLSAPKGSKFDTFLDFVNNPETKRTIGEFMPYYGYNPNTGRGNNVMEAPARRDEARFEADRQKALEQLKQQNALAGTVYDAYNRADIEELKDKRARELAEQEIKFRREEAALDRGLRREQMKNDLERAMIIHHAMQGGEGSGGGTLTGGAADVSNTSGGLNLNNIKMTAAERKQLTENKTTLANIESGLDALEKNPNAYSFMKGLLGSDITNRIDPKGVATRTQIDNITAVYRKWLTGAQMSDKERKAYERFLPAPTDNYTIVKAKLNGMKGAIERSNDAILSNYGVSSQGVAGKDSLGLGL